MCTYLTQSKRFIDYAPTSLERNYKYELLTEHDLGVHVDLILPEAYEKPEEQVGETSLPFRLSLLTISDIVNKLSKNHQPVVCICIWCGLVVKEIPQPHRGTIQNGKNLPLTQFRHLRQLIGR